MDWSYAAGFIDADGSLGFAAASYEHPRPVLTATQNVEHREVLDLLAVLIGLGGVYLRDSGLAIYRTAGFKLLDPLQHLEPYLIVKRTNAQRMIEFINCRQTRKSLPPDEHCLALVEASRYKKTGRIFLK